MFEHVVIQGVWVFTLYHLTEYDNLLKEEYPSAFKFEVRFVWILFGYR